MTSSAGISAAGSDVWDDVRARVCAPRGPWARLDVVDETGSTNADLAAAAARGPVAAPDRTVLLAHHQRAGRGRRTRTWRSRPGEGLAVSVLLRPDEVPRERWGWASLVAALALDDALSPYAETALKWPNDVQLGPARRKASGILAEVAGSALVVGIGLNVHDDPADLPDGATSLAAEGVARSRDAVLGDLLAALGARDTRWRAARGDPAHVRDAYRARCATLGQRVRVALASGDLVGDAVDVDEDGCLVVTDDEGRRHTVSAGDVVHVRPSAEG